MSTLVILYTVLLFFLLTPGILVTLPPKSSKTVVALTHAIVFGIVYHFTHNIVSKLENFSEGLDELPSKMQTPPDMPYDTSTGFQVETSSVMQGDTSSGIPTGMRGGKQTDLSSNSLYP